MKKPQIKTTNRNHFLKCVDPTCPSLHGNRKLNPLHVRSDQYKARGHKECKLSIACDCVTCLTSFKLPTAPKKIQKNLVTQYKEKEYEIDNEDTKGTKSTH